MTTPQPEQQAETISLPLQRAFRGYSKQSVQAVIQELTRRLAEAQQRAVDAEARVQAMLAERAQAPAPAEASSADIERVRDLERGLAKTLQLAEEAARQTQRQAEDEAQRVLSEAREAASRAASELEASRERAVQDIGRIREQLVRALDALDADARG